MLLSAHIDNFLNHLQTDGHTSKLTIKNYDHYLNRFLEFTRLEARPRVPDLEPKDITLELVTKYKLYLSSYQDPKNKRFLKKITQNYFLIALRAFLRYLAISGVNTLSAEDVKLTSVEPRSLPTLNDWDVQQLLDAPHLDKSGLRDRCILEILFSTGIRVSELILLDRETINLYTREVKILGKNGRQRTLSISDSAASWLDRYLQIRQDTFKPLFIRFQGKVEMENQGENMRLSARSIERIVEKYVKELNLSVKATPQTLRHAFATNLLTEGTDIKSVQKMLGHTTVSITQLYTHSISQA